jgi:hypothetical protein
MMIMMIVRAFNIITIKFIDIILAIEIADWKDFILSLSLFIKILCIQDKNNKTRKNFCIKNIYNCLIYQKNYIIYKLKLIYLYKQIQRDN